MSKQDEYRIARSKQEVLNQIDRLIAMSNAILDTIKESGSEGTPSGTLYAALMGHMSLENYEKFIQILIDSGRVRRTNHVLYYIVGSELQDGGRRARSNG